jgi:bifunctional UDP-N-acetylglucosamine pyrophosphorylase / glucosamine-1-phosphate N-acetyltransferase
MIKTSPLAVVILAAGIGTRMGGALPKVAISTDELPLIQHVVLSAVPLEPQRVIIVTGYKNEVVTEVVSKNAKSLNYDSSEFRFAHQAEQKGTGHAVQCALSELQDFQGTVLILCGDVPLMRSETLQKFISYHDSVKATVSLISFNTVMPGSYGRIIREPKGNNLVSKIVEARDCTLEELLINEVNAGVYAVDSAFLAPALEHLSTDNAQGELYLTDIVSRATQEGQTVGAFSATDPTEFIGVNDRVQLSQVNKILLQKRVEKFIKDGITFLDPDSVYIGPCVTIKPQCHIGPQVILKGTTSVGENVTIEGGCYLQDCHVAEGTYLKYGVRGEKALIGSSCTVGPFAHLRPGTELHERVKIGNFVETKNAEIHSDVSASHLTYLGDCEVGARSNVGAGTITCNYDGANKYKTTIEEDVFVGSNTSLVAPLTLGKGSTVGAGSVIQQNLPAESLGVTRAELKVKRDYKRKTRQK